ncbi:hypothetical protein CGLO_02932 [Colletotrichum gloeosporioides Cg-14]|uniref:Uncharacterized protein n=1 Tax=Colletotrichum gloeosporioides (strain Cg-14) TaxID=1237896 RepID=T0M7U2_COLGC|nr:hypothetical protein CGLO_02932 [Colletotrichum gloeosporioides Cg-14]
MASVHRSYFLSPSWDLQPNEVVLGSVIGNLKLPQKSISQMSFDDTVQSEVRIQTTTEASGLAKASNGWSGGIFSSFIQLVAVGGELSYSTASNVEIEYFCDTVVTSRLSLSAEYVKKVAGDEAVDTYLKFGGLNSKLFIITGVKVATGVTITTTEEKAQDGKASVGLDIPQVGVKFGPQGTWSSIQQSKHTITIDGPIVFAFQVEKLKISRRGGITSSPYVKGTMLGNQKGATYDFVLGGDHLEEEEVDDFGLNARLGTDGTGNQCQILW